MPTPKRSVIPVFLTLATIMVVLNAWLAFRSLTVLIQSENWMQHTWQVIYQVERVMGSAKDAETGNRGFLITDDDTYLAPYTEAVKSLPRELDELQSLVSDNASQQPRVVQMRAVLDERLALLDAGILLRRTTSTDMTRALVLSGTGREHMNHLRTIADDLEKEERRLLAERTHATRKNIARARVNVGLASLLDFILILLMFQYFSRERRLRLAKEEDARNLAEIAERLATQKIYTELKNAEVLELNKTLEERVRQRTAELETTNRELEAFSYSVSHDLRAPLRTIDGFSLALEEDYADAVDATGRDYILRVRNGVQRMGQLIDALLQLSRITRAEITRSDLNLSELAETVASNLHDENPGQAMEFRIEPGLHAHADPKLVQVALENLMGNAVKFSSKVANGLIEFGFDPAQKAYFVRDNGAGFDMFYKDKLFNAFNRLHGDKDFKGSGIGLATVARVVRRHHGNIWADSQVDHGATFWFTLE